MSHIISLTTKLGLNGPTPTFSAPDPGRSAVSAHQPDSIFNIASGGIDIEPKLATLLQMVLLVDLEDADIMPVTFAAQNLAGLLVILPETTFAARDRQSQSRVNSVFAAF